MAFELTRTFGEIAARLQRTQDAIEGGAAARERTLGSAGPRGTSTPIRETARTIESEAHRGENRRALGENTRALKDNTTAIRRASEALVRALSDAGTGVVINE